MITNHPIWEELKRFVVVEIYSRDGIVNPRFRLWLKGVPQPLLVRALMLEIPCLACGEPMNPVRVCVYGIYLAGSCALEKNVACSRNRAVSAMYQEVKRQIDEHAEADPGAEQLGFDV